MVKILSNTQYSHPAGDILHKRRMEPAEGFEPTTYCLQNSCSTTELCWRVDYSICK